MGIAAAITAGAGLLYSVYQGEKASDASKAANNRARRIEEIKTQRERARALATNRVNAANVIAQGANAGVLGSSAIEGTIAAMGTQGAVGFNEANRIDALRREQLQFGADAEKAQRLAGYGQIATSLGTQAYTMGKQTEAANAAAKAGG